MPMFANCSSDCVRLRLPGFLVARLRPVGGNGAEVKGCGVGAARANTGQEVAAPGARGAWQHTSGVRPEPPNWPTPSIAVDRRLLLAAAWLHDIGYAPTVRKTGFHPLDGGLYLRDHKWDQRLTGWLRTIPGQGSCRWSGGSRI